MASHACACACLTATTPSPSQTLAASSPPPPRSTPLLLHSSPRCRCTFSSLSRPIPASLPSPLFPYLHMAIPMSSHTPRSCRSGQIPTLTSSTAAPSTTRAPSPPTSASTSPTHHLAPDTFLRQSQVSTWPSPSPHIRQPPLHLPVMSRLISPPLAQTLLPQSCPPPTPTALHPARSHWQISTFTA